MSKQFVIKTNIRSAIRKLHYQYKQLYGSNITYVDYVKMMQDKDEFIKDIMELAKYPTRGQIILVIKEEIWYK